MAKTLSPTSIANLRRKPTRYEVPDGGCAGLRVTVHPSRKKSFIVRFRFNGETRKLTLGPALTERGVAESDATPEHGTPLSLAAARELATKALRQARSGIDPCAIKKRQRQQAAAAESGTLQAISDEYLRREGQRLRTRSQREADLKLLTESPLGRLPVTSISRGQFAGILDEIADTRGPVRSDRCLSALRTLLTWHATRSDYVSPLAPGGRRAASIAERARDKTLSDDELRAVWLAAEQDKTPFGPYVRFLLLTATRRSEAAGLKRGELPPDGKLWIIPGARYKNGKDHVVPLSAAAQTIIASLPDRGDFVFSATGSHPLSRFAQHKADFDKACGVTGWTLHDLRRTARTLLSRAGISADHAERCLGHVILGVRRTYDRFEYLDEKRHAFEALARMIEGIVHPSDNVVVLKKTRRK